jgi:hypothetical protein
LYKLTQLPQLLFDGIPTISDLLCLALSFSQDLVFAEIVLFLRLGAGKCT